MVRDLHFSMFLSSKVVFYSVCYKCVLLLILQLP